MFYDKEKFIPCSKTIKWYNVMCNINTTTIPRSKKCFLLTVLVLLVLPISLVKTTKVSFYGDGYVSMPLQEARMSTNIRVKFRTYQLNAFIFMASGRTDYCLMRLNEGTIEFTYKIEENIVQLHSPNQQKLNDLMWHDVAVQRYEGNITLQVDGTIIRQILPMNVSALNVHFGTFLGGPGEHSSDFLNDIPNFRGCISDVFYNNINIIKRAREGSAHTETKGISWTCSSEFDGTTKDSISFLDNKSYALITKDNPELNGETLSLKFRTMAESGVLFYNGGNDYVLLEIEKQTIKFHFNKDGSLLRLSTNNTVSDSKWHQIDIRYNSETVELVLDDILYKGNHDNGTGSTNIYLAKNIYVGGVPENIRKRMWHRGHRISDSSFLGCLRDIRFNNHEIGLPHINKSHSLALNCVWKYPCLEHEPCLKSGYCNQYGVDEFICYCDQSYCIKADFQGPYKVFTETSPTIELLYVTPMQLLEGGATFLSPQILDVLLDVNKIADQKDLTPIVFQVVQQPRFGQLLHFTGEGNNFVTCRSFNLVDLATDKIKYVHNGLENFNDHATLDMQIQSDTNKVPANILGKHRFMLHANITPINDPPRLHIAANKILRVVEGIEKNLDEDLFSIEDPDSPPNALIYTILPLSVIDQQEAFGRFLLNGRQTMTFSQADVNLGKVSFLYNSTTTEGLNYQLQLQVSDGVETSEAVFLPISVHPLELRVVNNTGLIMIHKSSELITTANLSIGSNIGDENIDIRYEIVRSPQYGSIQRLRLIDSTWIKVDWFSESQLQFGHIRYVHNVDLPYQDEFKFIASYGFISTQMFDFRIIFTKLKITSRNDALIAINGSREFILTNEVLSYETVPIITFPRNIIYKIKQPTKYGNIYVEGSKKYAKEMDSFTQLDIDKNRIKYKSHRTVYSNFHDNLEFVVTVAECEDVTGTLTIMFTPLDKFVQKLSYQTRDSLKVREGDKVLITKHHFEFRFNIYESLEFTVTESPKYGYICQYDGSENTPTTSVINKFTLEQLFSNEIYYCHDDSESMEDHFDLMILSSEETDLQFIANMEVQIELVNDNAPYRSREHKLHVMRGGVRTLNSDILEYLDIDQNTNTLDIIYMHITCTNGVFLKSGHYVDRFSQEDIIQRRIMFQHNGPDAGVASFTITDREHEINGLLEIQASEPFVKMLPTNATIVQEGKYIQLEQKDFQLETNLDVKLNEIDYEIVKAPIYGIITYLNVSQTSEKLSFTTNFTNANSLSKSSNFTFLSKFTQMDINNGSLVYWNTEISSMDKLKYRVHINNLTAEGEIMFRIYPSAYWEPLQIKRNQTLQVEESTSVLITRDVLEIIHPNISPGDITFLVTSSPMHGYLEMQSMAFDDEYNCKVFDQSAINTEKMFYIQAGVNQSTDYFLFDVTNGITWLHNLMLKIVIIPEKLYIKSQIITVVEGKTVSLHSSDIQPFSEYYRGRILEYIITENPISGYIMASNSKVKRFTQKQLDQGAIQYIHDGSENSGDSITIIAMARSKESVPFVIEISVLPVNDEEPEIITNSGLQVWNGGIYSIRYTDLMVRDADTSPENLTFILNYIYGGYIAYRWDTQQKIDNFTQSDIDREQIVFIHKANSRRNEISFIVSDGLFKTSEQMLKISVKPLEIYPVHNEHFHVFPLTKKQILREHLYYRCSDDQRQITYNITIPPSLGRIVREKINSAIPTITTSSIGNDNIQEVTIFTQEDLDNGHIFYEHTAVIIEFRINDSFYFDIIASRGDLLHDQKFNIEISVSSGGLLRFLPVSKLQVDEGGSVPIKLDFSKILDYLRTRAGILNPELYIEVIQQPGHGIVGLGHSSKPMKKFHPSDFSTKKVYYTHDHTDTLEDNILMGLYLEQGNIFLCNLSIPVTVKPVNDQPFKLLTKLPEMTVVEGENHTITRDLLLTEDKDTSPDDIIYDVLSGPTMGVLKKISRDGSTAQDLLVYSNQFTQADINNDRIVYIHYGEPQSTTFSFTVTDGKFNPSYDIFTIKVKPISLKAVIKQIPVDVQQGSTTAVLRLEHIALETNVRKERLSYNITNSPLYGIIVLKYQPTLRFNQHLFETGQIQYMQTDLSRSNDTFQVSAYVPGTAYVTTVDIIVQVQPVIKITNIDMRGSMRFENIRIMSLLVADNALSLKLNKFNPKFLITRPPLSGQIRKIIRSTGVINDNRNEKPINTFSYKELRSGIIYFIPYTEKTTSIKRNIDMETDYFEYQLHIKTVQPAQASVFINYSNQNMDGKFNDIEENDGVINVSRYELNINYLAIIACFLLTVAIITILLIVFVVKMCNLKHRKASITKDQPPPLPCPPDLTSVSPRIQPNNEHNVLYSQQQPQTYNSSETDSVTAMANSTTLPPPTNFSHLSHCRIIPMESYKPDYFDYDPDENDVGNGNQCDVQEMMLPQQYNSFQLDNDLWSSSCDMLHDFPTFSNGGYASLPQSCLGELPTLASSSPTASNPLIRRNQYWV